MKQHVDQFLRGLFESIHSGVGETRLYNEIEISIGKSIAAIIVKFRKELLSTVVAIVLVGTGFFLMLWGIASTVDAIFAMRGLGYVLIGLLGLLAGVVIYRK